MTNIYVLNFHYTTLIEKESFSCIILTLYMHAVTDLKNFWSLIFYGQLKIIVKMFCKTSGFHWHYTWWWQRNSSSYLNLSCLDRPVYLTWLMTVVYKSDPSVCVHKSLDLIVQIGGSSEKSRQVVNRLQCNPMALNFVNHDPYMILPGGPCPQKVMQNYFVFFYCNKQRFDVPSLHCMT